MDDKKKKLIKFGIIGFCCFLILLVLIVLVASCGNRSTTGTGDPDQIEGDYELIVYKSDSGLCLQKSRECNKSPFRINTVTEDAKIVAIASNNLYLLYSDNGIKLYDVAKSKPSLIDLEDKYDYRISNRYNDEKYRNGSGLFNDILRRDYHNYVMRIQANTNRKLTKKEKIDVFNACKQECINYRKQIGGYYPRERRKK